MEEFLNVLANCQLDDLGYEGYWFTWERGNLTNNNKCECLDRGLLILHGKIIFLLSPYNTWSIRYRITSLYF